MIKNNHNIGILLLRIFLGIRLIYGVIDNIISWEKMVEFSSFLESFNFPLPIISAITSVSIQCVAGISILVGFKTRLASILLIINFIIAVLFVHIISHDSIEGMTPALAMLFGSMTLFFTGAGKYSFDHRIYNAN